MEDMRIMYPCFVCSRQFEYDPDSLKGNYVNAYEIMVCDTCYKANWDGWAPQLTSRLTDHLKGKGLSIPQLNDRGWLPRDG